MPFLGSSLFRSRFIPGKDERWVRSIEAHVRVARCSIDEVASRTELRDQENGPSRLWQAPRSSRPPFAAAGEQPVVSDGSGTVARGLVVGLIRGERAGIGAPAVPNVRGLIER